MILPILPQQTEKIKESVLSSWPRCGLPLRFVSSVPTESLRSLLFDDLNKSLENDGARLFAQYDRNTLIAIALVQPQTWESRVLGVSVFTLQVACCATANALNQAPLIESSLDYIRTISENALVTARCWTSESSLIHDFERKGFLLMDTAVDVIYYQRLVLQPSDALPVLPLGLALRLAVPADEEALRDLAGRSFSGHFGRFHADPRLGRQMGTKVYQEWIASCLNGWANYVFLVEDVETMKPVGFSAWKEPSALEQSLGLMLGHYSIGAVSPHYAGRGVFKVLTHAGMRALINCQAIEGPTHIHNLPVQRGYQSLGWMIADSRHTFHAWIN